ncbi:hypothetical protein [Marinomonas sp. PE14-40]|uniref:hypothetical protein n=1 Tax=Marinomonas sp. PE14-40 TaxID=3060621 RepID=UPI003F67EAE5
MLFEFIENSWGYIAFSWVLLFGLSVFIWRKNKYVNKPIIMIFFVISSFLSFNAIFELYQSKIFKNDFENGRFYKVNGIVDGLKSYGGKDVFKVDGVRFDLYYYDRQCLSGKGLVNHNQSITVKYLKIKSLGNYVKRCIIEIN